MGTTMQVGQERRSFAAVMLLIAAVGATAMTSCGGGGGATNGELCQQCGESDGRCLDTVAVTGSERPSFCTNDPCTVELRCLRKLDSAQRRCFPADPVTPTTDLPQTRRTQAARTCNATRVSSTAISPVFTG